MISVVASGITDKNKLSKLNEIALKNDAVIKNDGNLKCKDLKTAIKLSRIVTELK